MSLPPARGTTGLEWHQRNRYLALMQKCQLITNLLINAIRRKQTSELESVRAASWPGSSQSHKQSLGPVGGSQSLQGLDNQVKVCFVSVSQDVRLGTITPHK